MLVPVGFSGKTGVRQGGGVAAASGGGAASACRWGRATDAVVAKATT